MMHAELDYHDGSARKLAHALTNEWARLCADYLPLLRENSIWRYSRAPDAGDPAQGWKLHVSATVLTANEVLKKVAPLLCACGTRFKAPASLRELQKLNCGLFHGYSQIGKFITVYPNSTEEAVWLAARLDELTRRMRAPSVPFDLRFRPDSCVYYRYGSFKRLEIENSDGTHTPAMRDPEGRLVPDVRESEAAKPNWVSNPFIEQETRRGAAPDANPLATTVRALQALAQRGKGGVYKALDLSVCPPRLCILKEGRAGGELSWDNRDGHWRVRHEERVLAALRTADVSVPRVYSSFELEGNYYLVTEFIEGETLQALLYRRRRRLPFTRALLYGVRLALLISRIHAAGWAWRDCKPANIIVTNEDLLRPLDFEGACSVERPDPLPWSTKGFSPPLDGSAARSGQYDDLYALGAIIYLLLTGRVPESQTPTPVDSLRRNIPARVRELIAGLLSNDPTRHTCAATIAEELAAAVAAIG